MEGTIPASLIASTVTHTHLRSTIHSHSGAISDVPVPVLARFSRVISPSMPNTPRCKQDGGFGAHWRLASRLGMPLLVDGAAEAILAAGLEFCVSLRDLVNQV
ncbi:MAG: hypothetical protein F6K11_27295 [Leptolyngbya sp. SIO3F4]|nr:hypothetical protein [Leptolyngbya sp. SIO3F4]